MTVKKSRKYCFFLFILFSSASSASAYNIPEKFSYELIWAGIDIGSSILETRYKGSDIQYISRVNSSDLISYFYKVDNTAITSLKNEKPKGSKTPQLIPYHYSIEVNEGPAKFNKEISSDHKTKRVTYIDHINREKVSLSLKTLALDPLSSLYYIRTLPLKVGKAYSVNVFNNKKLQNITVEVLKNETVETPMGALKTILIKPVMNLEGEGIFFAHGELYIWLTDDEKRIPVMIKKVIPGLSLETGQIEFLRKMPAFVKKQLKGNVDTVTARLKKIEY